MRRWTNHLREHAYARAMVEQGHVPLPLVLLEFTMVCDAYSRKIERDIADQLRAQGHSAYGDTSVLPNSMYGGFYGLVEEKAQRYAVLCEMSQAG